MYWYYTKRESYSLVSVGCPANLLPKHCQSECNTYRQHRVYNNFCQWCFSCNCILSQSRHHSYLRQGRSCHFQHSRHKVGVRKLCRFHGMTCVITTSCVLPSGTGEGDDEDHVVIVGLIPTRALQQKLRCTSVNRLSKGICRLEDHTCLFLHLLCTYSMALAFLELY